MIWIMNCLSKFLFEESYTVVKMWYSYNGKTRCIDGDTISGALTSAAERCKFKSRPRQTEDINTGSDRSFVKRVALRWENHTSFRYDLKNRGPMS
jgi:hypothetical protein